MISMAIKDELGVSSPPTRPKGAGQRGLIASRRAFGKRSRPWAIGVTLALALLFAFPYVWAFLSSLKGPDELFVYPPRIFPEDWRWGNYIDVWRRIPFARYALNSFLVAGLSVIGDLVSCSLVAYGFTRFRFPGKDLLFLGVLGGLMLPDEVMLIPQFIFFRWLGWLDSLLPLITPAFVAYSAFNIFLLRQFFRNVPRELEEAAQVDGAGSLRVLWSVYLPLSKPALVTVALFSFLYHWNDFLRPLIYLNSQQNFTLTLGLQVFAGSAVSGQEPAQHLLMAAAILMTLPVILLFISAQRYFIEGITQSGMKR